MLHAACCSVCGGSGFSQTQRRKSTKLRRCYTCVQDGIWLSTYTEDEANENKDRDPDCVEVDIIDSSGHEIRQTHTGYGRSVHMDDNTCYKIRITNNLCTHQGKRKKVAVIAKVDGEKVSPTPILVGAERYIQGFTQSRKTTEVFTDNIHRYTIRKDINTFHAKVSQGSSDRTRSIDRTAGTIVLEFYHVKMVSILPGTRHRNHRGKVNPKQPHRKEARDGLMVTQPGDRTWEDGVHYGGNKKPMADKTKPLGTCRLHICDNQVRTLGDYMRGPLFIYPF